MIQNYLHIRYFIDFWRFLSQQGIRNEYSITEKKEITSFNQTSFLIFLVIIPYIIRLYLFFPESYTFYELAIINTIFLIVPLLNHFHYHELAKTQIFVTASLMIFWSCNTFGLMIGLQFAYLLVIFGVVLYSNTSKNKFWFFPIALSFIAVYLLYYTDFQPFTPIRVPPSLITNFTVFNIFIMLALASLLSYIYTKNNESSFIEIRETNRHLEQKNEELQKLNEELDRFVYSVSHDLRSPIASVLGLIALSKNEENIETIRYYLNLKEKSIQKLDNFITDVLAHSRNKRLEVSYSEINFQEIIVSVFDLTDPDIRYSRIEKKINIIQQTPLYADHYRMSVIFNNLLSNALHYSNPASGKSFISINISVSEEKAVILIEDNGIGIATEHLDKIFNMFYRASERASGSGLGLYIVQEAVLKMNGSISVTSNLGEGTKFHIEIPNRYLLIKNN